MSRTRRQGPSLPEVRHATARTKVPSGGRRPRCPSYSGGSPPRRRGRSCPTLGPAETQEQAEGLGPAEVQEQPEGLASAEVQEQTEGFAPAGPAPAEAYSPAEVYGTAAVYAAEEYDPPDDYPMAEYDTGTAAV